MRTRRLVLLALGCWLAQCGGGGGDGAPGGDAAADAAARLDGAATDAPAAADAAAAVDLASGDVAPDISPADAPDLGAAAADAPDAAVAVDLASGDATPDTSPADAPDAPTADAEASADVPPDSAGPGGPPVPCVSVQECLYAFGPPAEPCRVWRCLPEGFCRTMAAPDDAACEDGLFCTVDDVCRDGRCLSGPPRDCSGDDPSVQAWCREDERVCSTSPPPIECESGTECDDGDPCTIDSCLTFVVPPQCTYASREPCACDPQSADGGAWDCDDGQPDTVDRCVPNTDPAIPHPGLCQHTES